MEREGSHIGTNNTKTIINKHVLIVNTGVTTTQCILYHTNRF